MRNIVVSLLGQPFHVSTAIRWMNDVLRHLAERLPDGSVKEKLGEVNLKLDDVAALAEMEEAK